MPVLENLPQLIVGILFTAIAGFKLYGLTRGIVGGAKKPAMQRLCGT